MKLSPFRWQVVLGALLGLVAAGFVAGYLYRSRRPEPTGPMLSDAGGPIRSMVLQYAPDSAFVLGVYCEFLAQCPAGVSVILAHPDDTDADDIRKIGARQQITHVYTHHAMTAWSRDRWVALAPVEPGAPTVLLSPRPEDNANWPQRAGDARMGDDVARALSPGIQARTSALYFDGGDLLADGPRVYVTEAVVARNVQHTVTTREELLAVLRTELGREPVILENAPPHHAGMYMMSAGNNTMVVADPSLGAPFVPAISRELLGNLPNGPDLSPATQKSFDVVADRLRADGYRVVRIPVLPDIPARVYLTYVNVILDGARAPGGKPVCYMPVFRGAEPMNDAAEVVWRSLGYDVRTIDCTGVFTKGGTLHCLVNVTERS